MEKIFQNQTKNGNYQKVDNKSDKAKDGLTLE